MPRSKCRPFSNERRFKGLYTTGELNKLVDAFLHPLATSDPYYMILDGVLHSLVEQNPSKSLTKFLRYSFPKLLLQLATTEENAKQGHRKLSRRPTKQLVEERIDEQKLQDKPATIQE